MEKKILIAVDNSRHSGNAVRYAAELFRAQRDVKITLFHVLPPVSQYLLDEARKSPRANAELKKLTLKNNRAAHDLLDRYRERTAAGGIPEADIRTVAQARALGVAKDILEYGLAGRFDAIVMGRRGVSALEGVFTGSVSANAVNNSETTPVWLVDEPRAGGSFLVAVDGSESSLRAVDHLAFMLRGNAEVRLTFLHVTPRLGEFCPVDFEEDRSESLEDIILRGDRACIDRFFSHAVKKLTASGLGQDRVGIRVVDGAFRVGKAVLDAFRKEEAGTLVLGRRGASRQFFTGSVSRYLINQASEGALWVVP